MNNKKINIEGLDTFFSFVSKAVIIIPIFVLIISLFLKINTPKNSASLLSPATPTTIPIVQNSTFKFDLKGPIVCDTLFIQDKKIFFKNKLTNYLLKDDCFYIWETGKFNGERKCNLSNYINMAENYLGFFNINDLVDNNLVKNFIKNKNINVESVVKSCKREVIKDKNIFEIPRQVLFKNK